MDNHMIDTKESGMTLIEILLAMVILLVGIVGILSVFSTGVIQGKNSEEIMRSAVLGDSVYNSLLSAMKVVKIDENDVRTVTFSDDFKYKKNKMLYSFTLPNLNANENIWQYHPGSADVEFLDAKEEVETLESRDAFEMGIDPWIIQTVEDVKRYDPSEPYDQYLFAFALRKIDSFKDRPMKASPPTPAEIEKKSKLYECRIFIFRKGGLGRTTGSSGSIPKEFKKYYDCVLAVQ